MKNVARHFIIFFIFYATTFTSYSQSEYSEGFYIDTLDQKVTGLIRNDKWLENPDHFYFKKTISSEESKIELKESKEFLIENIVKFKRLNIPVDFSLDLQKDIVKVDQFFRVLIEGSKTLYQLKNNNKSIFFLQDENEILQLGNKKYSQTKKIGNQFKTRNEEIKLFRRELIFKLNCNKLNSKDFSRLRYLKNDLMNIVQKYYKCTDEEISFIDNSLKSGGFSIAPFIQTRSNSMSISQGGTTLRDAEIDRKTNIYFGITLEYNFPFNKNNWSITLEPSFLNYSNTHIYEYNILENDTLNINHNSVEIPVGLRRYLVRNSKLEFYAGPKVFFNFSKESNLEFSSGRFLNARPALNFGLSTGIIISKRIIIEANFLTPRDLLTDFPSWKANLNSVFVNVGYNLYRQ